MCYLYFLVFLESHILMCYSTKDGNKLSSMLLSQIYSLFLFLHLCKIRQIHILFVEELLLMAIII